MKIKLEVTKAPTAASDVTVAQEFARRMREWASKEASATNLEVWVDGLIYLRGDTIGFYDPSTGEAKYQSGKAPD